MGHSVPDTSFSLDILQCLKGLEAKHSLQSDLENFTLSLKVNIQTHENENIEFFTLKSFR